MLEQLGYPKRLLSGRELTGRELNTGYFGSGANYYGTGTGTGTGLGTGLGTGRTGGLGTLRPIGSYCDHIAADSGCIEGAQCSYQGPAVLSGGSICVDEDTCGDDINDVEIICGATALQITSGITMALSFLM